MSDVTELSSAQLQAIAERAECLFSEGEVEAAIRRMAEQITPVLKEQRPLVLVVMNGGLITAGKLLTLLDFPLQVDYLHATRYRDQLHGKDLHWQRHPQQALQGRVLLLLDDILDEGETLAKVVDYCQQQGAARVLSAVLVEKIHDHKLASIEADFVGLQAADRYLYGYGMDYKGYLRNAAGIFAASAEDS